MKMAEDLPDPSTQISMANFANGGSWKSIVHSIGGAY